MKKIPETVAIDLPARDGTLLHLTLHQDENFPSGGFSNDSLLEVQEHTEHGLRPLVAYRVGSVLAVEGDLTLHDGTPDLTIERHWLTTLADWLIMMAESSIDVWRVGAPGCR
ncbi:hypothetical protein SEA_SATIS_267 [Streptomyces phage Satis]|nr:hypothetical protein SEA_SATIS_267 [Streptomyces phage Satis]